MSAKKYAIDLAAPCSASLRWAQLVRALDCPLERDLLGRLLADTAQDQGLLEHPVTDFESPATGDIDRGLETLRLTGWVHQRPGRGGVLTRLRRDDLDACFPGLVDHLSQQMRTHPAL